MFTGGDDTKKKPTSEVSAVGFEFTVYNFHYFSIVKCQMPHRCQPHHFTLQDTLYDSRRTPCIRPQPVLYSHGRDIAARATVQWI
jgi:hypothetical protein